MSATQDTGAGSSVAAILAAVSSEMAIAAQACGELDNALGQILAATPPEGQARVMQELHTVDLLAQHITAITDFTHRIALIAPTQDRMTVDDALSAITLGAVAERLRNQLAQSETA